MNPPGSEVQRNESGSDVAELVSETIPDGTIFPFGSTFTKTWTLRNSGNVPWNNRQLKRMTPNSATYPYSPDFVAVPHTLPGEATMISVDITVTRYPSLAQVRFKMVDEHGHLCWPYLNPLGLTVIVESRGLSLDIQGLKAAKTTAAPQQPTQRIAEAPRRTGIMGG
ncbi:hypothetical protein FHU41_002789 [Psychromicrobium silvestre]|uniref:Nbr1 FW domain-containing protein n=1 Tax=Psychromicrobium silvestre TaxID=1645614 RepID=A0A7Y9LVT8_9MICC|nr:hypothetical protein [Psychromicrobium silvestre]